MIKIIKQRMNSALQIKKISSLITKYENSRNKLFFIHIPKTAGTSFRTTFEKMSDTLKDYGLSSNATSGIIRKYAYEELNMYHLKNEFSGRKNAWITGHVYLGKYVNLVPVTNTITFVRHPVERVISQYQHHVKHHKLKDSLSTFIDTPHAKNRQSKCLSYLPLNLIGCIGITEYYTDSLKLINQQYDLSLSTKSKNINKDSKAAFDELEEAVKINILNKNKLDIDLYNAALFLHQSRMKLLKRNEPWTYGCIELDAKEIIKGCAYQYNNNQAITVVIKINDDTFKTVTAKEFYGEYVKANFPRERYIGFNVTLPKGLTDQDEINVYVKSTGQKLNFKPLTVKK